MGCGGSKPDESFAQHPPLLEEHVYQLNLPAPPVNGFDSFLTLQWCRDLREEADERTKAEKAAQKKKQDPSAVPPPPKKYYLCLVGRFEPYEENKTVNLQKADKAYQSLPKWQDPDFMEDMLANGPFYQNDAFILEHVPSAIRLPADYAYTEQYKRAYLHHHGMAATADQIAAHQVYVARTLWKELHTYQSNDNKDAKGRDRSRTVRKLEDILRSLEYDANILTTAQAQVEAEEAKEKERAAKAQAAQEAKKAAEEAKKAKEEQAKKAKEEKEAQAKEDKKNKNNSKGKKKDDKPSDVKEIKEDDKQEEKEEAKEKQQVEKKE